MQPKQLSPIYWLDRGASRASTFTQHREALAVTEGQEGAMRVWRWMMLRLVLLFAGIFGYQWMPEGLQTLLLALGGGLLSIAALSGFTRAQAYRRGWLEGRRRMRANMPAGVEAVDWLDAEFNYDTHHVLGLPPTAPPR